ncbi:hypothetical protein [Elongatibacter sediminis]
MLNEVRCVLTLALCALMLTACNQEQPVEVFVPPEGDPEQGRLVFLQHGCTDCHTIPDVDLPGASPVTETVMPLGVRMHRVRNYGDLLTSVIYPDHVVSPKYVAAQTAAQPDAEPVEMPDFTQTMTVAELIDVVEFLHVEYSRLLSRQYQGKNTPPRSRLERERERNPN